jgi:hypothetical protein
VNSTAAAAEIAAIHARHIFDWDHLGVGHYFYLEIVALPSTYVWSFTTYWPKVSEAVVNASIAPLLNDISPLAVSINISIHQSLANDQVGILGVEQAGINIVLGSRLVPESVYQNNISSIGQTYKNLLDGGTLG